MTTSLGLDDGRAGPYTGEPMGPDVLSALSEQTSEVNGPGLVLITDPDRRARLGAFYVAATEAFSWFRNDRVEIDQHWRSYCQFVSASLDDLSKRLLPIHPPCGCESVRAAIDHVASGT
jgi:hypothetical protein